MSSSTDSSSPIIDDGEKKELARKVLKGYLRNFLVPPLEREQTEVLSEFLVSKFKETDVVTMVTGTELLMKQVTQCAVLSFGRYLNWEASSSHELVRTFFGNDTAIFDTVLPELFVIYHGFDALPNKLTADHVNQIASSRSMRGKKTLILLKVPDSAITYTVMSVSLPASKGPSFKSGGKKSRKVSDPNIAPDSSIPGYSTL